MKIVKLYFLLNIFFATNVFSQVTIGSSLAPMKGSLLDLKENNTTGENSTKAVIFPRLSITQPTNLVIDDNSEGAKYVASFIYNLTNENGVAPGLYSWDGSKWNSYLTNNNLMASNGITFETYSKSLGASKLVLGGTLDRKTQLIVSPSNNFEVKSSNSTGGNLIVSDVGNVGINVASPTVPLHTKGSVIHENLDTQVLTSGIGMNRILTVNTTDHPGKIEMMSNKVFDIVGGRRPPLESVVYTANTRNAVVKVDFVYHVSNSSVEFDSQPAYYVYGSFTIIAMNGVCKMVDVVLKNSEGKNFSENTFNVPYTIDENAITWDYSKVATPGGSHGTQKIELDKTTGELKVIKGAIIFSYQFKFFGGI